MEIKESLHTIAEEVAQEMNEMYPPGELGGDVYRVLTELIRAHGIKDEAEINAVRKAVRSVLQRLRPALPLRRAS